MTTTTIARPVAPGDGCDAPTGGIQFPCDMCGGSGTVRQGKTERTCPNCKGTGWIG